MSTSVKMTLLGCGTAFLFFGCLSAYAQGKFEGRVVVEWLAEPAPERDMKLLEGFAFVDPSGKRWAVPAGAVINGASIPRGLWTMAGSPYTGNYRRASVIHDHYCDVRSAPWQEVHRVFYHAMRAAGVAEVQAKVFYGVVYAGGPRWTTVTVKNLEGEDESLTIPQLASIPPEVEDDITAWIRAENPSLEAIEQRVEPQVLLQ